MIRFNVFFALYHEIYADMPSGKMSIAEFSLWILGLLEIP